MKKIGTKYYHGKMIELNKERINLTIFHLVKERETPTDDRDISYIAQCTSCAQILVMVVI